MKTSFLNVSVFVVSFLINFGAQAQSYEDYLKEQADAMQAMQDDKDEYVKAEEKRFAQFVRERDSIINKMDEDFSNYLKTRWDEFESLTAEKQEEKPKPSTIPTFDPTSKQEEKEVVISEIESVEEDVQPVLPVVKKSETEKIPYSAIDFEFYGEKKQIQVDQKLLTVGLTNVNETSISIAYDSLASVHYNHLLNQIQTFSDVYNLNDWGYYKLVETVSNAMISSSVDAILYQWFLMTKSGFKVKLSFSGDKLYLLVATAQKVFDVPYLRVNGVLYYSFSGNLPEQMFTYEKDFPLSRKYLDCNLYSPINIGDKTTDTTLSFSVNESKINVTVSYNPQSIEYYRQYPKADVKVYFDANVHASTKESLKEALTPLINEKSFDEAVGVLLTFVQTAFAYKTDQDQFGYEKYFFADELFFYQYSDCEDRSILFAYLVRELMDLDVVGLEYSGHMATAVFFPEGTYGDYVKVEGEKYTVCDPTYVNAPIGQTMPQFVGETPKVIRLLGVDKEKTIEKVLDIVFEKGAVTADKFNTTDTDMNGNVYVTGHFKDTVPFDTEKNLFVSMQNKKGQSTNDIYVNKFTSAGTLLWARKISGKGNDIAHSLKVTSDGSVLFSGTFTDVLKVGKVYLTPKNKTVGDVFVAKCSSEGQLQWVKQLGLESLDSVNSLFSAKLTRNGGIEWLKFYEEDESFDNYGLSEDSTGYYFVGGSGDAPGLGFSTANLNDYIEYSPEEDLYEKSQELISDEYDPAVAGLFAALMLIDNTGNALPGRSVQRTISVHNPAFKKNSSEIYENLGKIKFMRNAEGVISIRTADAEPVMFQSVKVEDNAYLKISLYNSGNAKIDILSGVSVGKSILWYNLNYIKLEKTTGNLVLDYDTDHTQKTVNLKRDILQN